MGNTHDAALIRNEVLHVDLGFIGAVRSSVAFVLVANFAQLLFDNG